MMVFILFFFKLYLFERERLSREKDTEGEDEANSPGRRDPDMGLNPRTL